MFYIAAEVIVDRMATLQSMLGDVRRKEQKAKSGSAAYHLTHRDPYIKGKLGFLEKHISTRKTVSSLPEVCMWSVIKFFIYFNTEISVADWHG